MGPFTEFHAPESLDEALSLLQDKGAAACLLAGGTDLMVRVKRGLVPRERSALISLHRLEALCGCRREGGEFVVGASTTATALLRDAQVAKHAPILAHVADRLASAQIRNMATVGGNLVNASPAGDLISPLLLLDARLVLASAGNRRVVDVERFFTGPGKSVLRPDEMLVEIRFDLPAPDRVLRFEKAGPRPAMECSVVTVGLAYTLREGVLDQVRVAFGSSAPTPLRGRQTEAALQGRPFTGVTIDKAVRVAEREVRPISDIRGSEAYRRSLVGIFLRRLLDG